MTQTLMFKSLRFLATLFLISSIGTAKDISPIATIKTSGMVSDFAEDAGLLYVATDAGIVDIIDLSTQKTVRQIRFAPLLTAKGDYVPARIHSIDRAKGKTLIVTSAQNAYRNVWINDGNRSVKIIDETQHLMPKSARFSKDGKIILGSFGSDIVLYDSQENSKLYDRHISESTMGGMALSADKRKMVISDESGAVRLFDIESGRLEKTFSSEHVDNIYRVAYAKGVIVTAGQDRRVGVYRENGTAYHLKSDFLVYAVGLSPSGKTAVYSDGLDNVLQLFNTDSKSKGDRLVGHYATPNRIYFINERSIITSGDEEKVFFWKLEK